MDKILQLKYKDYWMNLKKQTTMCSLQETQVKYKDTEKLKVKGWENTEWEDSNQKKLI